MLGLTWGGNAAAHTLKAISRSQAILDLAMDGTILSANAVFLGIIGYSLADLKGKKHSLLVPLEDQKAPEYQRFWDALRRGDFQAKVYRLTSKSGEDVWLQASYNPVLDGSGHADRVVMVATNITERLLEKVDHEGQIAAINQSQAVIEFQLDATIISANTAFLNAMGYRLEEIVGQKHRLFIPAEERQSRAYAEFWERLNRGEYQSGLFRRVAKDGHEVWIQANYTPIRDLHNRVYKVVKFATDVTKEQTERLRRQAVQKSINENLSKISDAVGITVSHAESSSKTSGTTAASMQSVAAASEELAASINEISQQVSRASAIAGNAVTQAANTTDIVRALSVATDKIDAVVALINSIASQTNLLALNATIEAARAGAAGKGFAVVASEVKTLANQTAKATDEISNHIVGVQTATRQAVTAINEIHTTIRTIDEISSAIAAAIAEQDAVTKDISGNMSAAASGVSDISTAIVAINLSAHDVGRITNTVREAAQSIA